MDVYWLHKSCLETFIIFNFIPVFILESGDIAKLKNKYLYEECNYSRGERYGR